MKGKIHRQRIIDKQPLYDEDFLDDMMGLFPDASGYAPKAGCCGKYLYDGKNWGNYIEYNEKYYPPKGDLALIKQAALDIDKWGIPKGTDYIDLGAGGDVSFKRYALPITQLLESQNYIGVDFCDRALEEIKRLSSEFEESLAIKTEKIDLFFLTNKKIAKQSPALGVMNGLTLGNIDGAIADQNIGYNLINVMKYLSQLCGHGWLLLTIDTNQNSDFLKSAYVSPATERFCLGMLKRMKQELPVKNFDPTLFDYDVEFFPQNHLLASVAVAREAQTFELGGFPRHIHKGQKIHLCNSYKFGRDFFEQCVQRAGLKPVQQWEHETGMMLYLLKDDQCQILENNLVSGGQNFAA